MGNELIGLKSRNSGFLVGVFSAPEAVTRNAFALFVNCPHCRHEIELDGPIEFGKIYQFTCSDCGNKFVLIVPDYTIRKGLIEDVLHGESSSSS